MNYTKILPGKRLESVIQFFWNFESAFSNSSIYKLSSTASVNPKLAFQYETGMMLNKNGKKETFFASGFQSQTNSFYEMSADKKVGIFGVSFQPFAIPLLFNIPANALTNHNIEISDLLGNEGKILQDKIENCTTIEQRIDTIKTFVEAKLTKSNFETDKLVTVVKTIQAHKGNINIEKLSESYFLSQRQFERKVKVLTGFSPKTFAGIVRFEECINSAYLHKLSLTELSLSVGYYDQSHMIRDFRKFTGKNPKEYFAEDHSIFFV